jgi:predicted nucleic acid-binding protein
MIIVSNTTPLIGFATIKRFDLLYELFGQVHIPQAVYQETVIFGREVGGAKREVSKATWIETLVVKDRLAVKVLLDELDLGETETIVLAYEIGADWVLMDEKKGRRKLSQLGLNKIGTLGILLKAKQVGLLSVIKPEIEKLHQQGFSLSQTVIDTILHQANE